MSDTAAGTDTREKKWVYSSPKVQRWRQRDQDADQSGGKILSSTIHLAMLMQCILMGFLQAALCSTLFPQWECFLPAAEPGCANSGDIQVSRPEPCQALPGGRGRHNMRLTAKRTPGREKKIKEHLYNLRGYVLGAGCNCFPHFLGLVKLIHYQRRAVMPRAWQWAGFYWAFWHFLPCNSKQKSY